MCLTQEPLNPEDLDELLKFLFSLACQAGTRECLIAKEDITRILDDCFPSLDPKLLSLEGYACLKLFMLKVSGKHQLLLFSPVAMLWACRQVTQESTRSQQRRSRTCMNRSTLPDTLALILPLSGLTESLAMLFKRSTYAGCSS